MEISTTDSVNFPAEKLEWETPTFTSVDLSVVTADGLIPDLDFAIAHMTS